jgi:hypothetical protein
LIKNKNNRLKTYILSFYVNPIVATITRVDRVSRAERDPDKIPCYLKAYWFYSVKKNSEEYIPHLINDYISGGKSNPEIQA